jgi:hypothetical protein
MLGHLQYVQEVLKLGLEPFDGGGTQSLMLMCVDLFHCLTYVSYIMLCSHSEQR